MKSIYFKNFMISAGMVMFSFLVLAVAFVFLARGFLMNEKQEGLESAADEISKSIQSIYLVNGDLMDMDLRINISTISAITGDHILICGTDGVIKNCSEPLDICKHLGGKLSDYDLKAISSSPDYYQLTDLGGMYNTPHYVVAKPFVVPYTTKIVGYVLVSSESRVIFGAWHAFLRIFSATACAILCIAVAMSYVLSKQQAQPINEMADAARRFAHGDFAVRVQEDCRDDEVGELISSFNAMADSLEKSEQLRSEFIANISHELKTPMTTISGFADGILDGTIPNESQDKYLKTISDETKRLSRLVRRMLDLSRISAKDSDSLKMKEFDISETLRRNLIVFEGKITAKNLDVDPILPENSVMVMGDEDAITQVVYNLLDNSIKFAREGTTIGLSLWKEGGKAYVSVRNTGDTISPEEQVHIFDRFHKTDRSRSMDREGVGLGLYIVKSILGSHDEDIHLSSKDGETEFVFSLTLKPEKKSPGNPDNREEIAYGQIDDRNV